MNRLMKIGVAAIALATAVPAFAQENETFAEGPVGWTPIALGLVTPLQLPWGLDRWDVYGLDVNVFYTDAPRMYGIGLGGVAMQVRDDLIGLQVSGLFNWNRGNVYGLRTTLGLNLSSAETKTYGVDVGLLAIRDSITGVDVNLLGALSDNVCGLQVGGLANISKVESYGATIAGLGNAAKTAYGLQLAGLLNMTAELHGCQIALVNYADYCPNGFQIGLVNIIMSNRVKVLPFVNGYF